MKDNVRIHIDQKQHESPNPTTGAGLYALGAVSSGLVLYREVTGDHEDKSITNGPEVVHLRVDEHFHSGPATTHRIVVNGQERRITTTTVTYEEIVALAFPVPPVGQNIMYTVSYDDGPHSNPSGSLTAGGKVKVKDGMIFNVTPTDKS
jgi:hypothetical protein